MMGSQKKISNTQKQQHDYHNAKRENESLLDVGGVVLNTMQGIKSKSKSRFEPVVVVDEKIGSFTSRSSVD